jgi:tetratricopeptide (TPR) repeat protein
MPAVSAPLESAFVAKNRLMYDRLVTFLDFAPERFTLGFVSVNFGRDRVALIKALQSDPRDVDLQIVALDFADRELRYFKDALVEKLATIVIAPNKKLVLIITGLEFAIGLLGEYPLVLQDLNYVRDAFVHTVPYPIVFVLPDGALTRLAKFAPDLWAWRKSVFSFESSEMAVEFAHGVTFDSGRLDGSLSEAERHDRIDLLERLLTDSTQQDSGEQQARFCTELGKHYRDLGRVDEARNQLGRALSIAHNETSVRAKALQEMSELCRNHGEFDCALAYAKESVQISHELIDYQTEAYASSVIADIKAIQGKIDQSLQLREQILQLCEQGDYPYGKASTLNNMAYVIAQQGDIDRALALWNHSLEIYERIGEIKGKAITLSNMAGVIAEQGDIGRALQLWQESLEISERIGDVKGKAATLHNMARVIAQQGDIDRALQLWQESLEISERIGDVQVKATTLSNMAGVIAQQGDIDRALQLWQEDLEISERIGDVQGKAATLNNMAGVIAQQGDIDRALQLWQESLKIYERIGYVQAKANALSNIYRLISHLEKVVPRLEKNRDVKAFSARKNLDAMRQLHRQYTSQRKGFLKPPSKGAKKRK